MKKREYVIMLKSRKAELEKVLDSDEESKKHLSIKIPNFRRMFFQMLNEYFFILDTLDLPQFRRLA